MNRRQLWMYGAGAGSFGVERSGAGGPYVRVADYSQYGLVAQYAQRVAVMYAGRIVERVRLVP
jgi:hypothetical protein